MNCKRLYLIPNAHLDPVWLWPWRDGYSEAHNTVQAAVDRLRENPDMTFSCSSSSIYEWIEESNPALFEAVRRLVAEGRFEVVGGWIVQADTIISSGESLMRQAVYGKKYFNDRFGVNVEVAYSVDAFGHNSGLPKILAHSGFRYYVMHRPNASEKDLPNVFWWEGNDGSRILTLRTVPHGYNTSATLTQNQFSELVKRAMETGVEHQTFFVGVGDHGGGPTKQQIQWVRELQGKYNLKFSTLHDYFRIVEQDKDLPVVKGELTHHAPGCYSAHSGIKHWIARCGRELFKADALTALNPAPSNPEDVQTLDRAWWNYLFNHFHDIYPGSSVALAYEEARDALGGATDAARRIKIRELHRLAKRMDTSDLKEGGIVVYNPLPWKRKGIIEVDTFMDPNNTGHDVHSLKAPDGSVYPVQWCRAAVSFGPCLTKWGRLTALVDLPAMGYRTFSLEKEVAANDVSEPFEAIKWFRRLSFEVLYDPHDAWAHGVTGRLGETVGSARLVKTETLEKGPVRSRYRAFYQCADSSITLDLVHYAGLDTVRADVRVDWREVNHTLKMAVSTGIGDGILASGQAYDIIERQPDDNEQPMQDWLAAVEAERTVAVVSESTRAYDSFGSGKVRFTLLRAVPHAVHTDFSHGDEEFIDIGKQSWRFWLTEKLSPHYRDWLPRFSQELRCGAEHVMESNHDGDLPRDSSDRLVLTPDCVTLGACRATGDGGVRIRFYNNEATSVSAELTWSSAGIVWQGDVSGNSLTTLRIGSDGKVQTIENISDENYH
ncbi:MAG: hypothetical protein K9N51_05835 [Candidatus Pacebacteria bacterium]|nr:hypothetical protein [Candidatus Paceibacterota bacterium]